MVRFPLLLAAAVAACSSPTPPVAAPTREPPGYREHRALGPTFALPLAELFVPADYAPPADAEVPVYVHFQGGVQAARENFARAALPGVLIASTLTGRSGAFAAPYREPAAFAALLGAAEDALASHWRRPVHLGPVRITFWSAGYGAVRELLRVPEYFARIDMLVSADSIYATVVAEHVRAPRIEDVVDFARFAQAAARGEKTFALAHGRYQTDYASTAETAAVLRAAVAAPHGDVTTHTARGVPIARESHVGGFHCYEFAEATAGIHVDCLYFVAELLQRHAPR